MASARTLYRFFIALQLIGAFGMSVILATALLSPRVKRCSTWYTFCASWIVSCFAYSLLFLAGQGDVPRLGTCTVQAAFVYSDPILTAMTTVALLVHSWYNVHFGHVLPALETHSKAILALLVGPFLIWFATFLSFLSFGLANPSLVHRIDTVPYCIFFSIMPAKISSLFVIAIASAMLPVQVSLGLSLCRNLYSNANKTKIYVPTLKVVIRVMIFSLLTLVAFGEGVIHIFDKDPGEYVDIIMAWLPVSGVLIFGIQRDMLDTWTAWLSKKNKEAPEKSPTMPELMPDNSP